MLVNSTSFQYKRAQGSETLGHSGRAAIWRDHDNQQFVIRCGQGALFLCDEEFEDLMAAFRRAGIHGLPTP